MDKILFYLTEYNISLILALALLLTLTLAIWSFRKFLGGSDESSSAGVAPDMQNIEKMLSDVLARSQKVTDRPQSAGDDTVLRQEIEKMQSELATKQAELELAKKSSAGIDPVEKQKLESRIKELEAKLSEYEIIAEDIADLTRYKDENTQLKKKIAVLESNQTAVVAPSELPKVTKVEEKPLLPPVAPAPTPTLNAAEEAIDDDLMAEFAKAVEQQKKKETQSFTTPVDESNLNLQSILNEASALKEPEVEVPNSLSDEVDPEALQAEASKLDGIRGEDAALMSEFEDFAKGKTTA